MLHDSVLKEQTKGNADTTSAADLAMSYFMADSACVSNQEQRVIRQFVEALLFERIISFTSTSRMAGTVNDESYDAIFDQVFEFQIQKCEFRCLATIRAFDRVRIAEGSIKIKEEGVFRATTLVDLVDALDMDEDGKQRLFGELKQTVDFCLWNDKNLTHFKSPRRKLSFQDLESAIVEGHLYHPCFKTRTGFSYDDHHCFGPEAANRFQLRWFAVKHGDLSRHFPEHETLFWQHELGEEVFSDISTCLVNQGGSWEDYGLVPMHPWQYQAIQDSVLSSYLASGEFIDLGAAGDFYQSSQSLRTLINMSDLTKANIKLPMNVVCTSSHRNLQEHFVCSAPVISSWLQDIVARDPYLQQTRRLMLLSEYAGVLYEPGSQDGATAEALIQSEAVQGKVGCLFRESVLGKLAEGERALPFSALMLVESDGLPFIADWIEHYGVEAWTDQLLAVMLIPIWHMLVHHGIAFEAHSQNLILVHRNGWPEKIVLRDFHEDTEYVPDFLSDPENEPDLASVDPFFESIPDNDGFRMTSVEALRELFMDTVYVFNLADLAFLLERFYRLKAARFWAMVRQHLHEYEMLGVTSGDRIKRVAADRETIAVESLLRKKIENGGVLDYFEHDVRNALCPENEDAERTTDKR
ncbi:putative Rhizobactin siderophore biosynthesis protein RhsF [Oleiphilus messinensis]|uniref:Putative Rhizobactin siderophore biosynthesis protein RhsF n=1 Tax=Oleiphilus messinensis TaxID=141451 RepID=A0A1Y0I354_9GAMM|nr:IucA/IucC family protein [Oleiphilus messinensis]ARU54639.1 putative Rhizobactin siderophore biosynthesis protein RhsF [Oleiphilus messinensis]